MESELRAGLLGSNAYLINLCKSCNHALFSQIWQCSSYNFTLINIIDHSTVDMLQFMHIKKKEKKKENHIISTLDTWLFYKWFSWSPDLKHIWIWPQATRIYRLFCLQVTQCGIGPSGRVLATPKIGLKTLR